MRKLTNRLPLFVYWSAILIFFLFLSDQLFAYRTKLLLLCVRVCQCVRVGIGSAVSTLVSNLIGILAPRRSVFSFFYYYFSLFFCYEIRILFFIFQFQATRFDLGGFFGRLTLSADRWRWSENCFKNWKKFSKMKFSLDVSSRWGYTSVEVVTTIFQPFDTFADRWRWSAHSKKFFFKMWKYFFKWNFRSRCPLDEVTRLLRHLTTIFRHFEFSAVRWRWTKIVLKIRKKFVKMYKNQHFTCRVRLMQLKLNAITGMQFTGVLHFPPARWRWRGGPFRWLINASFPGACA